MDTLAQQGVQGQPLCSAQVGSFVAGTIGLILLTVLAPAFARLAQSFGPSETFLVVMIGLLTLVVIAGGKWRYGVISAFWFHAGYRRWTWVQRSTLTFGSRS